MSKIGEHPCKVGKCPPGMYQGAPGCERCAALERTLTTHFAYPHPPPNEWKTPRMVDLWEAGRAVDRQLARNRVARFDCGDHHALMRFKQTLLAWMDRRGYPQATPDA